MLKKRKDTKNEEINVLFLLCELSTCYYVTFSKGLFTHYVTLYNPEQKRKVSNKNEMIEK